jgi:hypothetical protein
VFNFIKIGISADLNAKKAENIEKKAKIIGMIIGNN